jgi:hypothetical protein
MVIAFFSLWLMTCPDLKYKNGSRLSNSMLSAVNARSNSLDNVSVRFTVFFVFWYTVFVVFRDTVSTVLMFLLLFWLQDEMAIPKLNIIILCSGVITGCVQWQRLTKLTLNARTNNTHTCQLGFSNFKVPVSQSPPHQLLNKSSEIRYTIN